MKNANTVPVYVETLVNIFNSMQNDNGREILLAHLKQLDYRETAGLCLNMQGELFFDDNVCKETLCRAKTRDEVQVIMDLFVKLFKAADALGRSVSELKTIKEAASEDVELSINIGPLGADEDHKVISNCSTFVSGIKDFYGEITGDGGMQFGTPTYETE
ncbi:hypothetical protein [Desulfovibrio sp. Fe33]|uniref:hypothetical protein n=1 Tax=Desulfovibrio sp. Fe33 TaxID=3020842 RepID=UPI00234C3026|nr:hypothetical protein [Desulfovibrio sp. Fe33]